MNIGNYTLEEFLGGYDPFTDQSRPDIRGDDG
jgi:hypothetical protein